MSIYVSGSLAFDRIMSFPDTFDAHILPEKLHILNVSFLIDDLVVKRGGCAGNIAYSLALMGERPRILACAGKDFGEYARYLESLGLPVDGIRILPDEFTPGCYLITDKNNNQINGFYPAAMRHPVTWPFTDAGPADWAIVSPGNLEDMRTLPRIFREKKVRYIYDPGQQIPALISASSAAGDALTDAIGGSAMLVTNDYELEMIMKATGKTRAELRGLTGCLITTLGERGSVVWEGPESCAIGVAAPLRVSDPTGAGDAFRSGLLKGLVHSLDVRDAARLGATCASFCVEHRGTQEHSFTLESFMTRHRNAFGDAPVVLW